MSMIDMCKIKWVELVLFKVEIGIAIGTSVQKFFFQRWKTLWGMYGKIVKFRSQVSTDQAKHQISWNAVFFRHVQYVISTAEK